MSALKSRQSQPVNVGFVDWISLAYQHYAVAVRNTRVVGQEVAAFLLWLEVSPPTCPSDSQGGKLVSKRSPCYSGRPQCAACRSETRHEVSLEPSASYSPAVTPVCTPLHYPGAASLARLSLVSMVCWLVYCQLDPR